MPLTSSRRDTSVARLLQRAAAGDAALPELLDARYRRPLTRYARSLLGRSHHDAEDVVQDVLLKAHAELVAGSAPEHLDAWMHRLTRNRAIDEMRRARWGDASLDEITAAGSLDALANVEDPPAVLHRRESLRTMVQDLADLPPGQRRAILTRVVDGESPADSAARLGVSVEALQMLVVRGRANLNLVRAARHATGNVETQLMALASPAAIAGVLGVAKFAGTGGAKLVAAGVAAALAVTGGVVVERRQHAGPGQASPFLVTDREFVGKSVAQGRPLPAATAVAAVTVRIPPGALAARDRTVTLTCPTGMVFASQLMSSSSYARLVGGLFDPRPDGTVHFTLTAGAATKQRRFRIAVLCRKPGAGGSIAYDPRLPQPTEGRGVLCHDAYFYVNPEHLLRGTVFHHQRVTITRQASRSVLLTTDTRLRGWVRMAALCPGWSLPATDGGLAAAKAKAAADPDTAVLARGGKVPGVMDIPALLATTPAP